MALRVPVQCSGNVQGLGRRWNAAEEMPGGTGCSLTSDQLELSRASEEVNNRLGNILTPGSRDATDVKSQSGISDMKKGGRRA